jgi:hypothetical protein
MSGILPAGWLTSVEAEALTGYTLYHLSRLARGGQVNAQKVSGRVWLFERESLMTYQATARPGPKPKAKPDGSPGT